MTIKELQDKLLGTVKAAQDISEKAVSEGREFSSEERETVSRHLEEAKGLREQVTRLASDNDMLAQMKAFGDLGDIVTAPDEVREAPAPRGLKSVGDRFIHGSEYKSWRKSLGDSVSDHSMIAPSAPMNVGGMKALITGTSDTSGGAFVFPQDLGMPDGGPFMRPLTIRDIITTGTTGTDQVEYVRQTAFTNSAAPTAEATAATGTSGTKPESAMTFERVVAPVKTIAHWVPTTNRALSDAGQVRTLIDSFLRYGLEEALETQIITGNGTGENLTGIQNTSGIQTQAFSTTRIETARKARTKVTLVGRATPTAYVIHPTDWEALDLTKDNEQRYYFGGPMVLGTPRLWGLPVVESEAIPVGKALVGDFRQAVLWDREQASVQVGTINDQFVRNMVTLLAELRASFGVFRPKAFVEITWA